MIQEIERRPDSLPAVQEKQSAIISQEAWRDISALPPLEPEINKLSGVLPNLEIIDELDAKSTARAEDPSTSNRSPKEPNDTETLSPSAENSAETGTPIPIPENSSETGTPNPISDNSAETPPDPRKIEALGKALDSDRYREREDAEKALKALGLDALPELEKILSTTSTPEQRVRAKRLIDHLEKTSVAWEKDDKGRNTALFGGKGSTEPILRFGYEGTPSAAKADLVQKADGTWILPQSNTAVQFDLSNSPNGLDLRLYNHDRTRVLSSVSIDGSNKLSRDLTDRTVSRAPGVTNRR